jgi:hypothetical protein
MDKNNKKIKQLYDSALGLGWLQLIVGIGIIIFTIMGSFNGFSIALPGIIVGSLYVLFGKKIKDKPTDMSVVRKNAKNLVWISGAITALNVVGTILSPMMGAVGIANTLLNTLILWYAVVVVRLKELN